MTGFRNFSVAPKPAPNIIDDAIAKKHVAQVGKIKGKPVYRPITPEGESLRPELAKRGHIAGGYIPTDSKPKPPRYIPTPLLPSPTPAPIPIRDERDYTSDQDEVLNPDYHPSVTKPDTTYDSDGLPDQDETPPPAPPEDGYDGEDLDDDDYDENIHLDRKLAEEMLELEPDSPEYQEREELRDALAIKRSGPKAIYGHLARRKAAHATETKRATAAKSKLAAITGAGLSMEQTLAGEKPKTDIYSAPDLATFNQQLQAISAHPDFQEIAEGLAPELNAMMSHVQPGASDQERATIAKRDFVAGDPEKAKQLLIQHMRDAYIQKNKATAPDLQPAQEPGMLTKATDWLRDNVPTPFSRDPEGLLADVAIDSKFIGPKPPNPNLVRGPLNSDSPIPPPRFPGNQPIDFSAISPISRPAFTPPQQPDGPIILPSDAPPPAGQPPTDQPPTGPAHSIDQPPSEAAPPTPISRQPEPFNPRAAMLEQFAQLLGLQQQHLRERPPLPADIPQKLATGHPMGLGEHLGYDATGKVQRRFNVGVDTRRPDQMQGQVHDLNQPSRDLAARDHARATDQWKHEGSALDALLSGAKTLHGMTPEPEKIKLPESPKSLEELLAKAQSPDEIDEVLTLMRRKAEATKKVTPKTTGAIQALQSQMLEYIVQGSRIPYHLIAGMHAMLTGKPPGKKKRRRE